MTGSRYATVAAGVRYTHAWRQKRKLHGKALQWLYNTNTLKNPSQMKSGFAHWTCGMLRHLIDQPGRSLSKYSISRFTIQVIMPHASIPCSNKPPPFGSTSIE